MVTLNYIFLFLTEMLFPVALYESLKFSVSVWGLPDKPCHVVPIGVPFSNFQALCFLHVYACFL